MSQIILVTSPNYTGKTTATANIGAGLARSGKKVLMIDMDTEYGKTRLDQILVVNRKYVNLCLMTIQQHEDNHLISQNQICRICDEWRKNFDYIIICACANGYGWRQALISSVDLTLIVTYPELACLREADKIIYNLAPANNERIKVLINFMGLSTEEVSPEDVRECLGTEYIGLIP